MPFDWNNYLTLAEQLAAQADEGSKRSAISRAYYYVFNLAFARAESTSGRYPGGQGFHAWCWSRFQNSPHIACKRLASNGERLKRRRVQADYKAAEISRLEDQVQRTLEEARQFGIELAALDPRYPSP